jgi:hypothetical protein
MTERSRNTVPAACEPLWGELASVLPSASDTAFVRACLHRADRSDWADRIEDADAPAERTALLPLLYRTLKRHRAALTERETTLLREAHLRRAAASHVYLGVCDEVVSVLAAAKLTPVLLKGAALGRTVYPDAVLRPASDIDLLLRESELTASADALLAAGWRWKEPPIDFGRHHLSPLQHRSGLAVELHRRLFSAYYDLPAAELFERSRVVTLGRVSSRVLSPEDALIHVCVHAARCRTRSSLHWIADAWFLLQPDGFDWDVLLATARRGRLALPLAIMVTYLADEIEVPVPASVVHRLWADAAETDETGREAARLGAEAPERLRIQDVLVAPRNWPSAMARVRRRLFPPASEIALSHGVDEAHAAGYQAYRVWCFVLRNVRQQ